MVNSAANRHSVTRGLRRLRPFPRAFLGLSVAMVALLSITRCSMYDKNSPMGLVRKQSAPRLTDSLDPATGEQRRVAGGGVTQDVLDQVRMTNELRYKPDLYTKVSIVSDPDIAPVPIELPRDRGFRQMWEAGFEESAVVSALVDTRGKVEAIRFRQPSRQPCYDSAVSRSVRSSVFAPLRSDGLRVKAWVRLKYDSNYTSCDFPERVHRY